MRTSPRALAAGLCLAVAVLAAGCGGPRACLRPGYVLRVLEPDGTAAPEAVVTFQPVVLGPEGEPTTGAGRTVTAAADGEGRVVVGPQREDTVLRTRRTRLGTLIRVALPDGRRAETVHPLPREVKCELLEFPPLVLQDAESER